MYTTIRSRSFVLLLIILVLVAGCGPRTEEEKQNYEKNIKELGPHRNHMNWGIIFATVVGIGWAAYRGLSRCLAPPTRKRVVANFAFGTVLCVCGVPFLCGMESCNTEDSVLEADRVVFLETEPSNGSEIVPNATIIARFDGEPTDLRVSTGRVAVNGETAEINGPFTPGILNLTLTWTDGDAVVSFTVQLPDPGEVITFHSSAGLTEMVLVPASESEMGSNDAQDPRNWLDTAPVHTVYLDAFYIDVHAVTNLEWQKFITENPEWQKENIAEEFHDGFYLQEWENGYPLWKAQHPVVNVSWYAAMAYAAWARKRLPTEAEWEKASRGNLEGMKYPWGDSIDSSKANYDFNVGETVPVTRYLPNGYGVHQMSGNVWEWVLDEAQIDFYKKSPLRNPLAGGDTLSNLIEDFTTVKTARVMRGGSFYSSAEDTTVTVRGGKRPDSCLGSVGFRCVKDVSP